MGTYDPTAFGNKLFADLSAEARLRAATQRIAELESEIVKLRAEAQPDTVLKTDDERRIACGWFYVAKKAGDLQVVDVSGDVVEDPSEIEDAAYRFTLNSRNGRVDHNGEPIAQLVESVAFTPEKIEKMGFGEIGQRVIPQGWWGGFYVSDDRTWQRIKDGELTAFSIGGVGKRTPIS